MDLLKDHLNNIVAAATQLAASSTPLAELSASLSISIDTVVTQAQEIAQLHQQITALNKISGGKLNDVGTSGATGTNPYVCPHCTVVGCSAPHKKNSCFFNPQKMTDRKEVAQKLMDDKGVACKDEE